MHIAQQVLSQAPEDLFVEIRDDRATIGTRSAGGVATYVISDYETLSADLVEHEVVPAAAQIANPFLVVFRRASPEARQALRAHAISYAGADGRWFLLGPGLYVERDDRIRPLEPRIPRVESPINPFGIRTSRVIRWLLLHPGQSFAIVELSRLLDLSRASVSRTVAALEDEAFVETHLNRTDRRSKQVGVAQAGRVLAAWLGEWRRRRVRRSWWDVGTGDVDDTLSLLKGMHAAREIDWALGGVAGASMHRRAVDPRDVLVWTTRESLPLLTEELMPVETLSPGRANMRVAIAPDPFLFRLARETDGIPLADPVQLWLDCMTEGERAMEAAAAIALEHGW